MDPISSRISLTKICVCKAYPPNLEMDQRSRSPTHQLEALRLRERAVCSGLATGPVPPGSREGIKTKAGSHKEIDQTYGVQLAESAFRVWLVVSRAFAYHVAAVFRLALAFCLSFDRFFASSAPFAKDVSSASNDLRKWGAAKSRKRRIFKGNRP